MQNKTTIRLRLHRSRRPTIVFNSHDLASMAGRPAREQEGYEKAHPEVQKKAIQLHVSKVWAELRKQPANLTCAVATE